MSFPRYPKYKASGVEWLGEVPDHWDVKVLKHIVSTPITDGPHETPDFPDEGIPFVSAEAVATGKIDFTKIRGFISPADHQRYSEKYRPRIGDVYMVKSGATTGVTAIVESDTEFNIWSPLAAIRCGDQALPRFVLNFMRSQNFQEGVTLNWSFGTQQNIGMRVIENLAVSLPSVAEQSKIASFLDGETSKIDGLVGEQRRLIELLKEKRQAVISHAVTKGLNPHAPLKPSGIEWLGDVPEHWEVVALKNLVSRPIIDGPHVSPQKYDEGIPFVSAESIGKGFIDFDKKWGYISPEDHELYSQRYRPERGDILLVKLGATTGVPAIVETDAEFNIWVPLAAIRLSEHIQPRFIFHVLRSNNLRVAYELNWTYGTQQTLGLGTISNLRMPVPPKKERQEIVDYLDSVLPSFASLEAEAERGIELLQERRTALVSAAVTGKIDVRGLASMESQV